MAANQMRWMLFLELAAYVALGIVFGEADRHLAEHLALALALFIGLRVLIVGTSYAFLAAYGEPVAEPLRVGALGMAIMMAQELLGLLCLFAIVLPFERYWMGRDRLGKWNGARLPILLIHGYQCNRGFWIWLRGQLEQAGWSVATHNLEPVLSDIDSYAEGVNRRIEEVLDETGAPQVILVGHSMGGLVSRAFLRHYGKAKVAQLITLGSPHHGSRLAALAWGPNGRQMRVGNAWLAELAGTDECVLPERTTSIYSVHDNQVMPASVCSMLPCRRNLAVGGVSHLWMAFSPKVRDALLEELARSESLA